MSGEKLRTFIAIVLSKQVEDSLANFQEVLKKSNADVKWVKPENIHLTLIFLGDTDYALIPKIVESLENVRSKKLTLTCFNLGGFPDLKKPHNLWLGIKETKEIIRLQEEIAKAFRKSKIQLDNSKKFLPHITFARFKKPKNLVWVGKKFSKTEFPKFKVKEIVLFESDLTANGPKHQIIKKFPLP